MGILADIRKIEKTRSVNVGIQSPYHTTVSGGMNLRFRNGRIWILVNLFLTRKWPRMRKSHQKIMVTPVFVDVWCSPKKKTLTFFLGTDIEKKA